MATIKRKNGGTMGGILGVKTKVSGSMVNAVAFKTRVAGVWVTAWTNALTSASTAPATCNATGTTSPLTTNTTTCTPVGGTGHTYTWELVSGNNTITPTAGSAATTAFTAALAAGQLKEAVYRCKVVAGGVTVYSNNVTIQIERP